MAIARGLEYSRTWARDDVLGIVSSILEILGYPRKGCGSTRHPSQGGEEKGVPMQGRRGSFLSVNSSSTYSVYIFCGLCVYDTFRSKRDMAGEKELREKQLVDLQKQLAILEGEIATAENDEAQFDGEVKRGVEQMTELRFVIHLISLAIVLLPH